MPPDRPQTSPLATVAAELRTDRQAAEVIAALAADETPCTVLKGSAFAALLYPGEARGYDDTDLLVPAGSLARAGSVLSRLGYVARPGGGGPTRPGTPHAEQWDRARDDAHVDLHERPKGVTVQAARVWEVLAAHTVSLEVGGEPAQGLDRPASGMLCALHLAAHGLSPKPREDLRRALALLSRSEWETAYVLALELGAAEAFGAGLRFLTEGGALANRLGVAPGLSAERLMQIDPKTPPSVWTLDIVLAQSSVAGFLRSVLRVIAPSPASMRRHIPLARRGRVALIGAYGLRPLRLACLLPPALCARTRARRASRRLARSGH